MKRDKSQKRKEIMFKLFKINFDLNYFLVNLCPKTLSDMDQNFGTNIRYIDIIAALLIGKKMFLGHLQDFSFN